MKKAPKEEKLKPFRLVKYFTFISLVVIFMGTLVLSLLNTHWARSLQLSKREDYALALLENLNHQVFIQFIVPVALKYGKIQLSQKEQFDRMDSIVRATLHSFKIERVNIYDMNNIISYSYDSDLIGKQDLGGTGYLNALDGKTSSKLVQRGNFFQLLLGFPEESKIVTFSPIRAEEFFTRISGPVLGVIEIVQDISEDDKEIFKFQIFIIITCALVMGVLFLVMVFIVKRGEGIIERRAQERLELKEQLSRAKHLSTLGEMVAGVSHEIRNPLGIIKSSAELLNKRMKNVDPSNPISDIIVEEASRLDNIITDFLNYARPKTPNRTPCRIDEVLEKNIKFLTPQIQAQGYRVELKYDKQSLPMIIADADMLYQAFLNLLINGMQSMPGGGLIEIHIRVDDQHILLDINDEGEGIAEGISEKIWDPFFTNKEKGTGLGLGIVKNIIEAHNGQVEIRNRADGGASVSISLPVNLKG